MALNVGRLMSELERMTVTELRRRYAEVFGEETRSYHKAYLVRRIAWRVQANAEGLPAVFEKAGFAWRAAGCSMCLAMNPDRLEGREVCASSSNRNFIGRQGSPEGRTLLMSPAMVAAAAVAGHVVDVRALALA